MIISVNVATIIKIILIHPARFVRGRVAENKWREPFSPFVSRHMKDDFSEGNAWQYTWLVPQDVEG